MTPRRGPRPESALRRQRARQNRLLLAALMVGNGLVWLFTASWPPRGSVLMGCVLVWPLLVVVAFDRRRSV